MRLVRRWLSGAILAVLLAAVAALGLRLSGTQAAAASPDLQVPALAGAVPAASVVATARPGPLPLYTSPSGTPVWAVTSPDRSGQPLVFLVRAQRASWLQVFMAKRPNGSTAWIPAQDVTLTSDPYAVTVSTTRHVLTVWKAGRVDFSVPVAVGTAADPTPVGRFFLAGIERQPDPAGAYGPYAFATSAFSDQLFSFGGGPGQIGLHGTDEPSSIGHSASHGCIRVTNQVVDRLVQVLPLGTALIVGR